MMTKLFSIFSFTLLFLYSCGDIDNSKESQATIDYEPPVALAKEPDKAEQFLLRFYVNYLSFQAQEKPSKAEIDQLLRLSCTPELISKLATEELDADPFLNVQDVDLGWAVTLKAEMKSKNNYEVSFITESGGERHIVPVRLVETTSSYKIASVGIY